MYGSRTLDKCEDSAVFAYDDEVFKSLCAIFQIDGKSWLAIRSSVPLFGLKSENTRSDSVSHSVGIEDYLKSYSVFRNLIAS